MSQNTNPSDSSGRETPISDERPASSPCDHRNAVRGANGYDFECPDCGDGHP